MNKLPPGSSIGGRNEGWEVAQPFWIVKVMSATAGETGADFLAVNLGWGRA